MQIVFDKSGIARTIYTEQIDLNELGHGSHTRVSHVEPDEHGEWFADLSPAGGPMLGPFKLRSEAIKSEIGWLEANVL